MIVFICLLVCLFLCAYRSWKIWSLVMIVIKCGMAGHIQFRHSPPFSQLFIESFSHQPLPSRFAHTHCPMHCIHEEWGGFLREPKVCAMNGKNINRIISAITNTKQSNNNLIALVVCTHRHYEYGNGHGHGKIIVLGCSSDDVWNEPMLPDSILQVNNTKQPNKQMNERTE